MSPAECVSCSNCPTPCKDIEAYRLEIEFKQAFDKARAELEVPTDLKVPPRLDDTVEKAVEENGGPILEFIPNAGRYFESGAYRDTDVGKNDYEGYLSPLVIEAFGDYMTEHRMQSDGRLRASDNWQKGIPQDQYMKSMWRHFLAVWKWHRYGEDPLELEDALCALLFNVMGYLHEHLKEQG